ncbi:MAG: hypothetical protein K1X47_02210 [Cyclobacteriaceae bacterium]|nr:hypothetical protein [Cyclobacteriaceae bacterium]
MKNLEDFIRHQREALDHRQEPADAWPRIEAALPGRGQRLWNHVGIWRVAAAIGLICSVTLLLMRPEARQTDNIAAGDFQDIEKFYSGQITEKIELIRSFDGADQQETFTDDLQKLEAMYDVLLEEMKRKPTQKVRDALILNLLVRIDLLNQQIHRLEVNRQDNKPSDV